MPWPGRCQSPRPGLLRSRRQCHTVRPTMGGGTVPTTSFTCFPFFLPVGSVTMTLAGMGLGPVWRPHVRQHPLEARVERRRLQRRVQVIRRLQHHHASRRALQRLDVARHMCRCSLRLQRAGVQRADSPPLERSRPAPQRHGLQHVAHLLVHVPQLAYGPVLRVVLPLTRHRAVEGDGAPAADARRGRRAVLALPAVRAAAATQCARRDAGAQQPAQLAIPPVAVASAFWHSALQYAAATHAPHCSVAGRKRQPSHDGGWLQPSSTVRASRPFAA